MKPKRNPQGPEEGGYPVYRGGGPVWELGFGMEIEVPCCITQHDVEEIQ